MSEALIYIIIFAVIMFFMYRGHDDHVGGGMGGYGCHSHCSHQGHRHRTDEYQQDKNVNKESEHQHHH